MKFNISIVKGLGPEVWSGASLGFEVQTFEFKLDKLCKLPQIKEMKEYKMLLLRVSNHMHKNSFSYFNLFKRYCTIKKTVF